MINHFRINLWIVKNFHCFMVMEGYNQKYFLELVLPNIWSLTNVEEGFS